MNTPEDYYRESDELADNMKPPHFSSFDEAVRHVRSQMPDETAPVICNVAERLWRRQRRYGGESGS
jgi:hypothetical protein